MKKDKIKITRLREANNVYGRKKTRGDTIKKTAGVIDVETLKKKGKQVKKRKYGRTQQRVLEFMQRNSDKAMSQRFVAESLGIREQQARTCLHALKRKNLVDAREMSKTTKGPRIFWYLA